MPSTTTDTDSFLGKLAELEGQLALAPPLLANGPSGSRPRRDSVAMPVEKCPPETEKEATDDQNFSNSGSLTGNLQAVIARLAQRSLHPTKDEIRAFHEVARQRHITQSQAWIRAAWKRHCQWFAEGKNIRPERIQVQLAPVTTNERRDLFRLARLTWSLPYSRGYGRRLRFLVIDTAHHALVGVLGLQSPPIDFGPRDQIVQYPDDRKIELVNQTMDIFTLGAVPPYRELLGCKLMIYAAASREIREAYRQKYAGVTTAMRQAHIPAELVMLTTTSAFGRSSVYNRVSYRDAVTQSNRKVAERLGYTKGYGSYEVDAIYPYIKEFLKQQGEVPTGGFGSGPRSVWQNISKTMRMLNISGNPLKHGVRREAWAIPLAGNAWDYLAGRAQVPEYYDTDFRQMADWWRERWLLPRAERTQKWFEHRRESVIQSMTVEVRDHGQH